MAAEAPAFAEVVVGVGDVRGPQTFHYGIPPDLREKVRPGQLVLVPFGTRQSHAVVLRLSDSSPVEQTRPILSVIWEPRLIDGRHLEFARWVSQRYGAPILEAVELVAPPGLTRHLHSAYTPASNGDDAHTDLSPGERRALALVRERGEASESEIRRVAGKTAAGRGMRRLVRAGLVDRRISLRFPLPAGRRLAVVDAPDGADAALAMLARAPKQRALWAILSAAQGPVPVEDALAQASAGAAALHGLVRRGLVRIEQQWTSPYVIRAPLDTEVASEEVDEPAWSALETSLDRERPGVVLLQGDQADRQALYLRAINFVTAEGRQVLVIAPDPRAAAGLAEWLAARATGTVAEAGRAKTDAGRVALWQSARAGELDVIVGTRSSTFAPLTRIGLVIVDREEDRGHKNLASPRYHVRPCAERLASLHSASLILGAETPSVESFYRVDTERYRFVMAHSAELLRQTRLKVGRGWGMQRPAGYVDVIDMRAAQVAGRYRVISRDLFTALRETLDGDGRAVLYVNRRGMAALTVCRDCGHVFECERCSAGLVQHGDSQALVCHMCNWRGPLPRSCPTCHGNRLRLWGYGSEAVTDAVAHLLPHARVARVDSDRPVHELESAVHAFAQSAGPNVLIGTQRLLAFGAQLRAELLGVVQADIGLRFPDFLAPERVFLALMRLRRLVTGGATGARTLVQTLMPDHHVIEALRLGSYIHFFRAEIAQRQEEGLPPFRQLVRIAVAHQVDARAEEEARRARRELDTVIAANQPMDIEILGPAPAAVHRMRGQYRWQLLLFGEDAQLVLPLLHRGWTIDVDPIDLT